MIPLLLPSEEQKKESAFRDKPRTEEFGEDFVIEHITGLAEWGTIVVAVVRRCLCVNMNMGS